MSYAHAAFQNSTQCCGGVAATPVSLPTQRQAIRVMIVGVGPHAQRTYIPHLKRLAARFAVSLPVVVDVQAKEVALRKYFADTLPEVEFLFAPKFQDVMPDATRQDLDRLVRQHRINAVIVSTEPLAHKVYTLWALSRGLHVMLDKPITTRPNVVSDLTQALGIEQDYLDILAAYERLQNERETCLVVNSHRRFHPGFAKVLELIREIRDQFHCPVTSVRSFHADGQWRLPAEIAHQDYHPYNQGYGKVSHSGYHILDAVYRFFQAGAIAGKSPDELRLCSSFVQPAGFLKQLTEQDSRAYFGPQYDDARRQAGQFYSDAQLESLLADHGEMDAQALLQLTAAGVPVAQANITLLHNSFSRRTWVRPGADLYKGNGRVKHEEHYIALGPFRTIMVQSYQANDKHDRCAEDDFAFGGNNHFDIHVFDNSGMMPDPHARPLRTFSQRDLTATASYDAGKLYTEQVKEHGLVEFLGYVAGELSKSELSSNITDHQIPMQMMSAFYASHILSQRGENPWVRRAWQLC